MTKTRKYVFYKRVSNENKAILITGCDSGFGHAIAKRMDHLGYHIFAACLDPHGKGGAELIKQCSSRLQVLPLDVTSDQSVQFAKDYVMDHLKNNVLWAVLNNAGIALAGEIDWVPLDHMHKVFDINTMGILRVTKAFLPLLKKSKGRLINNTSICGDFICPGFVGYCMSKSAANAFTYGFRIEMMKWEVKVISIRPFFYKTPLTCKNSAEKMIEETWLKVDSKIREDYGENYKKNFLKNTSKLLSRGSTRIHEVIDCFEDALTSVEPLSTYTPAYSPDKLGIKLLKYLPNIISEIYLKFELDQGNEPKALQRMKEDNKVNLK
ncbi:estradiol 17-beta-dehydrogenase 2 [Nephila pilipes]|uniref:Estradiol 17-beta-dehydrogenase 2 n=1 Tax=Nephila pilipes TaxID=299642 RepID=A0A8X6QS44_NEPPI|nr:estradiol 17-beta-dehydrogenase 2 [Nephila pilipes]